MTRDRKKFGLTVAAAAFLWVVCGLTGTVLAEPPAGFTCLGSALPETGGILGHVPALIKERNLRESISPDRIAAEKWGVAVSPDDEKKGYLIFSRNYLDPVYSYSLPDNRTDRLAVFTSLGEYRPVSFAFYPLQDIKGLRVSVTDLAGRGGEVIKSENVDIRIVRTIPVGTLDPNIQNYTLVPCLLEKFNGLDLSKGKTTQVWLTIYAPTKAVPGDYTGKIRLEGGPDRLYELKLVVRVLPIKLQAPETNYGMCFLIPGKKYMHPENLDKYFVDMREHNLNSMWTWPDSDLKKEGDKVVYDFSKFGVVRQNEAYYGNSLDEIMAGYLKAGFTRPWICGTLDSLKDMIAGKLGYQFYTPEFDAAYIDYVKQLLAHAKEKGWPEFCLHPQDEPSNGGYDPIYYTLYYYELLKKNFPEVKTFSDGGIGDQRTYNWPEDKIFAPYLDIMCYGGETKEEMDFCRRFGIKYYFYNHGGDVNARVNRDRWGWYAFKIGTDGVFDWVYTWWAEPNMYNDWNGFILPAPDGPVPTVAWEAVRDGIDDAKYAATLSDLIDRADRSGRKELASAVKEAKECLSTVLAPIEVGAPVNDAGETDTKGLEYLYRYYSMPSSNYDLNRWRLAREIIRLQSRLENKAVTISETSLLPVSDDHTLSLWHFEEGKGTAVSDDKGRSNGAFGAIEAKGGNPFWTKGVSGSGLQFTWLTAPVVIPLADNFDPKQFTYEAWINYQKIAGDGSYFGSQGDRWSIRLNPNGNVTCLLNVKGAGWKELTVGPLFPYRWYHVAVTYDGGFARLYIDGALVDHLPASGEIGGTSDKLFIGSNLDGSGGRFFGRIDEVRLSNVARSFNLPWEEGGENE